MKFRISSSIFLRAAMLLLATLFCAMGARAGENGKNTPLTLEFPDGGTITVTNRVSGMQYSIDGGSKATVTSTAIAVAQGQKVQFYGNGTSISSYPSTTISCSADCYVYGNIMSLVDETGFATATTLTAEYTFRYLFKDNSHLKNHASKKLLLPATTLTNYCYYEMFRGCSGLTEAPALPATTLTGNCYKRMFAYCTNLNYIEMMATDIGAVQCLENWVSGVASTGVFVKNSAATWTTTGTDGIPSGWTVLSINPATETVYTIALGEGVIASLQGVSTTHALNGSQVTLSAAAGYTANNYTVTKTADGTDVTESVLSGSTLTMPAYDITVAATLTAHTFTVKFDANGGVGTMAGQPFTYGVAQPLTACTFTPPSGKVFSHWNTAADGSGTSYTDGADGGSLPADNNATITLYAQWAEQKYTVPLTLEFPHGGTVTIANPLSLTMHYSLDGGEKQTVGGNNDNIVITPSAGQTVQLYGNGTENAAYYLNMGLAGNSYTNIQCSTDCYIYGNMMSLVDENGFATNRRLTAENTFRKLFYTNGQIKNHADKELLLPATTITKRCYEYLFNGCWGLTKAPELPATNAPECCYWYMFSGCTSLVEGPKELPALTLSSGCYYSMFSNCPNLIKAPKLPATTLSTEDEGSQTYHFMFYGDKNLHYMEMMATELEGRVNFFEWNGNFPSTGYFVKNENATWANDAVVRIVFDGDYNKLSSTGYPTRIIPEGWNVISINPATEKTYDINLQEGTAASIVFDDHQSYSVDFAPNGRTVTLSVTSGYTLAGGFTVTDASNTAVPVTETAGVYTFTMPESDVNVTAQLTSHQYTLHFDANGGSGTLPADLACTYGSDVTLPDAALTRDGYTFIGWNTDPDGGSTNHEPGSSIKNMSTADGATVTLYADWECPKPLTLEAVNSGTTTVTIKNPLALTMHYSIDGGAKQQIGGNENDITIQLTAAGQTLQLYGNGTANTYICDGFYETIISCDSDCYVYGNIMSLLDEEHFVTCKTLTAEFALAYLFAGNTHLKSHPTEELSLPASALSSWCYYEMFRDCTGLVRAPQLHATTLSDRCYDRMFYGCTALTKAPKLQAETLIRSCYYEMFNGCTSLKSVEMLATDISADYSLSAWLQNTGTKGAFVKHTNMQTLPDGDSGIRPGWHVLSINPATEKTYDISLPEHFTASIAFDDKDAHEVDFAPNGRTVTLRWTGYQVDVDGLTVRDADNQVLAGTPGDGCYTFTMPASPVTVMASSITAIQYTLKFTANGGSGSASDIICTYDQPVTLPNGGFARDGYVLKGWNTAADGSGISYALGEVTENLTSTAGDFTLYAEWENTIPLTLEAIAGGTVTITNPNSLTIKYSTDGGANKTASSANPIKIDLAQGQTVQLYGNGTEITSYNGTKIQCSADCYIYGNIMSLVDENGFATNTTLTGERTFCQLFNGNTHLKSHPTKELQLPATTLAASCYSEMFWGCTSLTRAPQLPASTLTEYCYTGMFKECSQLNYVEMLATDVSAQNCLNGWLYDAPGPGLLVKNTAMTSLPEGTSGIPEGWHALSIDPATKKMYRINKVGNGFTTNIVCDDNQSYSVDFAPNGRSVTLHWPGYHLTSFSLKDRNNSDVAYTEADGVYKFTMPASDVTVTPVLVVNQFTVRYHVNGGVGPEYYDQDFTYGTTSALVNNFTAPDGLFFAGWSTKADGTGTCYYDGYDGGQITAADGTIVDLYAQWMEEDMVTPLTLEFIEDGNVTIKNPLGLTMKYKKNNGEKQTVGGNTDDITISVAANDTIQLYGNGTENDTYSTDFYNINISCTVDCYIYGNIMSLVDETGFATNTTLTAGSAFDHLFYENIHLKNHATKELLLPATALTENCYNSMFINCTSLTKAPELPATTLAEGCYYTMFSGCTSLTKAPELPATTLPINCYAGMFSGCTNLSYIEMLASDISSECLINWVGHWDSGNNVVVQDVPTTGIFVKNSAMTTLPAGPWGIPESWNVLSIDPNSEQTYDISLPEHFTASIVFDDNNAHEVDFAPNGRTVTLTYTGTIPDTGMKKISATAGTMASGEGQTATLTMPASDVTVSLADVSLTISDIETQTYTGSAVEPAVTVVDGETTLTLGTDYTVAYTDNMNAGTATATITGKGLYVGSINKTFTISPKTDIYGAITITDYGTSKTATINGSSEETINIETNITVNSVTLNRTFTSGKPSTVMLPFSIATNNVSGAAFYTFSGVSYDSNKQKWIATMNAVSGTLAANTPYLVVPTADGVITFTGGATLNTTGGGNKQTTTGDWTFHGTYAKKTWTELGTDYGFAATSGTSADANHQAITAGQFVRFTTGAWMKPMRCYLSYTGSAPAPVRGTNRAGSTLPTSIVVRLVAANGSVTSIGTLDTKTGEVNTDGWYDLSGRKLSGKPTKKGLYINNGRKIVIK